MEAEDEEEEEEEMEEMTIGGEQKQEEDLMDTEEHMAELERYKQQRAKAKEDAQWPDEMDTPEHVSARVRFQRYRGLKSFRNSPWDPKESLPLDYAKIFQFSSFGRAQKSALATVHANGVEVGTYVTLVVAGVPRAFAESDMSIMPMICAGLFKHENKMSLVHFKIQRSAYFDTPLKSKEPLQFHVGFRRYIAKPVFSQHINGADKHKMERYWQPDASFIVASVYAPITYLPSPVLCFSPPKMGSKPELVGSGALLSVDPDRIILKRIVLTGHPFRVHQTHAVVRFMFHSPEDIKWFKPVELFTKLGLVGNVKESLGTHGYMKCTFNKRMAQHDTICMPLYKRVYPKWNADEDDAVAM